MANINSKLKTQNSELAQRAFTLVELIIVVAILGILAAIVLPEFQGHVQKAKESAAKDDLRILRQAIERYAVEHNDVPPGYTDDDPINQIPFGIIFANQLVSQNYLSEIPENPFNGSILVKAYKDTETLPNEATGTNGWLYHPATKQIKLDHPGTDSEGKSYYSY